MRRYLSCCDDVREWELVKVIKDKEFGFFIYKNEFYLLHEIFRC